MLGHCCRAHDRWERINKHAGYARCNARKILAHHARRCVGFDDRCAGDTAESIGRSTNRIVGASRDAITTSRAAGQELELVDRARWAVDRNCSRDRLVSQVRRRDRINVDAANAAWLHVGRRFGIWFGIPHHQRRELGRWNKFPKATLQQVASASIWSGGCEKELQRRDGKAESRREETEQRKEQPLRSTRCVSPSLAALRQSLYH